MEVVAALASWAIEAGRVPSFAPFLSFAFGGGDPLRIKQQLGPQLSTGAVITLPGTPEWDGLVRMFAGPRVLPTYAAAVEVATERDVQLTIDFANERQVPFLAKGGGHGVSGTTAQLQGGIQINMRKLNSIEVHEQSGTVTIGGGVKQHQLVNALASVGKQTVTGTCECTSIAGPLLGGGHGLLQGRYGLLSDNLVSARLVLGNGSVVEASAKQHPDLFWAIQGAGHNFGIATSLEIKAHEMPKNGHWTVSSSVFTHDKLDDVLLVLNKLHDAHPVELIEWAIFSPHKELDPVNPVIITLVAYEGTEAQASAFTSPYEALGPISTTTMSNLAYTDLSRYMQMGLTDPACTSLERNYFSVPVSLDTYNVTSFHQAYDLFADVVRKPGFESSVFLLENYGTKAVKAYPSDHSAVPPEERYANILSSPSFAWTGNDPAKLQTVRGVAAEMRSILDQGAHVEKGKTHAYVNYASGVETPEMMYGHEAWRLEKLRALKRAWDPNGRFSYYAPLV